VERAADPNVIGALKKRSGTRPLVADQITRRTFDGDTAARGGHPPANAAGRG
jgi:hypothetical protein